MIIRVSGHPGAGKTVLCQKLSQELGYGYTYAGKIFREMAAERGKSIEDFYLWLADHPEMEKEVDERQAKLMREQDNYVVEGRVAPFLPTPFKAINVLMTINPEVGLTRQSWRPENSGRSLELLRQKSEVRLATERERYRQLYGIEDHFSEKHFDIVVDTTDLTPEQVSEKVLALINHHIN